MDAHLVVDIGTSSLKAALLGGDGVAMSQAKVSFSSLGGADLENWNPLIWDGAFREALGQLKPEQRPVSITISGNGPTLVPMGGQGEPAANALLWLQRKRPREIPSGSPSYFLPYAGWFRENRPREFAATRFFSTCPGYLSFRLTGVPCAISPGADFDRYMWDPGQLASWGFDASLFPDLTPSGGMIGRTGAEAAERFGLPDGIPVYAGGPDYMMAVVGSGAVRPGVSCDRAGTSEGINFCSERAVESPSLRTLPHAVPGLFTIAGILASTGRVFEWFRRITNQTERDYGEILREIRSLTPVSSAPRFFPSRHRGPVWDFDNGIFAGLQPDHTHVELGKGVVEAIAFGIRDVVETLGQEGCRVASLRGSGGQYRNLDWNRMKADILGVPLEIPAVIDCELMGNLCAAMVGEGRYAGLAEAASELVRIAYTIDPDVNRTKVYDDLYRSYRLACDQFTAPRKG